MNQNAYDASKLYLYPYEHSNSIPAKLIPGGH